MMCRCIYEYHENHSGIEAILRFLFCIGFSIQKLVPVYSHVLLQYPPRIAPLKRTPHYMLQEKIRNLAKVDIQTQ